MSTDVYKTISTQTLQGLYNKLQLYVQFPAFLPLLFFRSLHNRAYVAKIKQKAKYIKKSILLTLKVLYSSICLSRIQNKIYK